MRKLIQVTMEDREVNIQVLKSLNDVNPGWGRNGVGYIDESDLEDLETPAKVMCRGMIGEIDDDLVEKLMDAFENLLTPYTVHVYGR